MPLHPKRPEAVVYEQVPSALLLTPYKPGADAIKLAVQVGHRCTDRLLGHAGVAGVMSGGKQKPW